jgi:asparagine synthase
MEATKPQAHTDLDLVWAGPPLQTFDGAQVWAYGYAFAGDGRYLEDLEVARVLLRGRDRLEAVADQLNGCFAVALFTDDGAILVTDRDGSVPLYTARAGNDLVVSNDPWRIVDELPETPELDDGAVLDMLRLGYVAGERTLARGITLMPPATVWRVRHHRVQSLRYWRFRVVPHGTDQAASERQLADALAGAAGSIARHLRESGRTSAMALSGGLDTRLWTALLARERPERFRSFSYGAAGDREVEIATRVAELLGIPHERVELSPSYLNDEFIDGAVRATGFTTRFTCGVGIRHYDGSDVDTFLTGHGGCFSDFNYGLLTAPVATREQARRYLYWRNYQLDAADEVPRAVFDVDYDRVKYASIDDSLSAFDRSADPIGEVYRWGLENRQRKLILMEHRLYEAQGRWLLPMHDHRVTAYFMQAPRSLLIGQRAYKDVALQVFTELSKDLATTPRIGGDMSYNQKMAIAVDAARRLRWLTAPLFPLLVRKSTAFTPAPAEPLGADPLRYWFHTDDKARNNMLERVSALDIPYVDNRRLRDRLVAAQNDKIFVRMLPGALTVHAFIDLLRERRHHRATR